MFELFEYSFMQRALAAGILVGFLASYYGVFIVQRKVSFLGSGLAHAAFGGVALGLLLKLDPLYVAIPFTVIVSIIITWLKSKTDLGGDTVIGVLFSISVALGIIFIYLKEDYSADAFTYLFGSILSVNQVDLISAGILVIVTILTFFKIWSRWAYSSFDQELAKADKVNVQFDDYLLSILIAVTIVVSIKIVGIILISAYLVIPAAAARLISRTFYSMTVFAIVFGVLGSIIGLVLSTIWDLPSGAVIIITQATIFVFSFLISRVRRV